MKDRLVFFHLPKTAGTSLRKIFRNGFGASNVSEGFVASRINEQAASELDRFQIVSGHISRADQVRWFPERKTLAVLRHPIDRCVSWIYYARGLKGTDTGDAANMMPMDEFIANNDMAQRNLFNRMVRQLGGHVLDEPADLPSMLDAAKHTLSEAAWVARRETFRTDLERLERMMPGLPGGFADLRENVTLVRPALENIPPSLLSALRSMNEYDMILWNWAAANLFEA